MYNFCSFHVFFEVIHVTVGRILEDMDAETFVGMETKKRVEKRLSTNPSKISRVLNLVKTESWGLWDPPIIRNYQNFSTFILGATPKFCTLTLLFKLWLLKRKRVWRQDNLQLLGGNWKSIYLPKNFGRWSSFFSRKKLGSMLKYGVNKKSKTSIWGVCTYHIREHQTLC